MQTESKGNKRKAPEEEQPEWVLEECLNAITCVVCLEHYFSEYPGGCTNQHSICPDCYDKIRRGRNARCPLCPEPLGPTRARDTTARRFLDKLPRGLPCRRCGHCVPYGAMVGHLQTCGDWTCPIEHCDHQIKYGPGAAVAVSNHLLEHGVHKRSEDDYDEVEAKFVCCKVDPDTDEVRLMWAMDPPQSETARLMKVLFGSDDEVPLVPIVFELIAGVNPATNEHAMTLRVYHPILQSLHITFFVIDNSVCVGALCAEDVCKNVSKSRFSVAFRAQNARKFGNTAWPTHMQFSCPFTDLRNRDHLKQNLVFVFSIFPNEGDDEGDNACICALDLAWTHMLAECPVAKPPSKRARVDVNSGD